MQAKVAKIKFREVYGIYGLGMLEALDPCNKSMPSKIVIDGFSVNRKSIRLQTFATKGCKCVACGLEAAYLKLEKLDAAAQSPHFNMYGLKNGEEILFTMDHIKPKSKGGEDKLENLDTMCTICNLEKSNKWEEPDGSNSDKS